MDLLAKQLSKLNDEVDGITSDIRDLYRRRDSEKYPAVRNELAERIKRLETKETDLNSQRRTLEEKLQPGGTAPKG